MATAIVAYLAIATQAGAHPTLGIAAAEHVARQLHAPKCGDAEAEHEDGE